MRIVAAIAACVVTGFGASRAQAAEPKEEVLINFADSRRDPDGKVFHAYQYAFGDWNKHLVDLPRRGILVKAPTGKGGMGENDTLAEFNGFAAVGFHFLIGNANQAQALSFSLEDSDGTAQTWKISLAGRAPGRTFHDRLDLAKPDSQENPGKKPGLNLKKISTWQVKGDFTDPNVEVLLVKITGEK